MLANCCGTASLFRIPVPRSERPRTAASQRRRTILLSLLGIGLCVAAVALAASIGGGGAGKGGRGDAWTPSAAAAVAVAVPSKASANASLYELTRYPSLAGTHGGASLAHLVSEKFRDLGFAVEEETYYPMLSYPKHRRVALLNATDASVQYECVLREPSIAADPTSTHADMVSTFNAYAATGNVTAELVYANYGRLEDFNALSAAGVNVSGKIVLARYGKNFRGLKVMLAEERGAVGVLLYSDPGDDGENRGATFPNGPWRPGDSVQRGSIQYNSQYDGDPLTPGYPATLDAQRRSQAEANIPKIPVLPLSANDAMPLMEALGGTVANSSLGADWQGGFNFLYRLGNDAGGARAVLDLGMNNTVAPIINVIATIPGAVEPDREVLVGNHRDAWVFGAIDPHTGTASLLEIARALSELRSRGWKPRRTIRLCSWDAEEYGLIGSTEHVEGRAAVLRARAVAYLNVDISVEGTVLRGRATPTLANVLRRAAGLVSDPADHTRTLLSSWITGTSGHAADATCTGTPPVCALGSGSDFTPFLQHLGVAATDLRFAGGVYGVYHSIYDSYTYSQTQVDPGAEYQAALARVLGAAAVFLADEQVLSFNYTEYAVALQQYAEHINSSLPATLRPEMSRLFSAIESFATAAASIGAEAAAARETGKSDLELRALNDRLALSERALLIADGLPGRSWFKHAVYAPGVYAGYAAAPLPAIAAPLLVENWNDIPHAVYITAEAIRQAASVLSG